MINTLTALSWTLAFLIFPVAMLQQDISIDQSLPPNLTPGQAKTITVQITKGQVQGFAKYQINLPEGLNAEMVEGKGASFTFVNGKAKFIWMALPESKSFEISYKLSAQENAAGAKVIDARFSYIKDNQRKNFDEPEQTIRINGGAMASEAEQEGEKPGVTAEKHQTETPQQSGKNAMAEVTRSMSRQSGDKIDVEVAIKYSDIEGFARLEENLPEGYSAINLSSSGAVFKLKEPTVKFLWSSLPKKDSITVKYRLLPMVDDLPQNVKVNGTFSFLKDGETVSREVGGNKMVEGMLASRDMNGDTSANQQKEMNGADTSQSTNDKIAMEEEMNLPEKEREESVENAKKKKANKDTKNTKNTTSRGDEDGERNSEKQKGENQKKKEEHKNTGKAGNMIVDVPNPDKGVNYRVQIAAGKHNVQVPQFKKRHQFFEAVYLNNIDTWFKYTTGNHGVYKEARDDRERITGRYDKLDGPFVAAYNNGERITVQEALMITSQKWVP